MDTTATPHRIHPLMATAAVSLTLVSLVGAAAIAGLLPNSRGAGHQAPDAALAAQPVSGAAPAAAPVAAPAPIAAPATKPVVIYRTVVRHDYPRHRAADGADAQPAQAARYDTAPPSYRQVSAQQPMAQQPVQQAQNSPLGIGIGALVGGLVGSKVGGGNGRTLAAIAGAVGGGYLGNEIARRNQLSQAGGQQQ